MQWVIEVYKHLPGAARRRVGAACAALLDDAEPRVRGGAIAVLAGTGADDGGALLRIAQSPGAAFTGVRNPYPAPGNDLADAVLQAVSQRRERAGLSVLKQHAVRLAGDLLPGLYEMDRDWVIANLPALQSAYDEAVKRVLWLTSYDRRPVEPVVRAVRGKVSDEALRLAIRRGLRGEERDRALAVLDGG